MLRALKRSLFINKFYKWKNIYYQIKVDVIKLEIDYIAL